MRAEPRSDFGDDLARRLARYDAGLRISDEQVETLSKAMPGVRIERFADGSLHLMSPTGRDGARRELAAARELDRYARTVGGVVDGANAAYTLRDGSVLSPDASWCSDVVEEMARTSGEPFPNVIPGIVVEVLSRSDSWIVLKDKIDRWHMAGVPYAVALNPKTREIYDRGNVPSGFAFDYEAVFDAWTDGPSER